MILSTNELQLIRISISHYMVELSNRLDRGPDAHAMALYQSELNALESLRLRIAQEIKHDVEGSY